jgi:peroxiredoxin
MATKALVFFLTIFLLALTPALGEEDIESKETSAPIAPSFTLKDINNKEVVFDSLLGKGPVVLDFWAIWCKPCIKELDSWRELYKEYKERGLEIVAINQDDPRNEAKIKPFVKSRRWNFPVLLDPNRKVRRLYQVTAFPTTFILDSEGRIRYTHQGFKIGEESTLEEEIVSLLPPRPELEGEGENGDSEKEKSE